jgi:phage repressor protein C with HTH and peptisase S24 domain
MEGVTREAHQGRWLKTKIERSGISKSEFARRIGVTREQLQRWFTLHPIRMRRDFMWLVLDQLKLSETADKLGHVRPGSTAEVMPHDGWQQFVEDSSVQMVFDQMMRIDAGERVRRPLSDEAAAILDKTRREMQESGELEEPLDGNVEPYSETKIPFEIPLFELSVAAGDWSDVVQVGEITDPAQIDIGVFRIRLSGDSMKPKYKSGDVVEFRTLREGRDRMRLGRDYYVQKGDGTATFKQLWKVAEGKLGFCARNKKRCPKPFYVERADIVRMAEAVAKVELLG